MDDFRLEIPEKEIGLDGKEIISTPKTVSSPKEDLHSETPNKCLFGEAKDINLDIEVSDYQSNGVSTDYLRGTDVTQAITGEIVKSIIMDVREETGKLTCVIDITKVRTRTRASLESINYCLSEKSETHQIEVYLRDGELMNGIGYGNVENFYKIMPDMLTNLFGNDYKLYFNNGKGLKKFNPLDASIIRLNLR